MSKTNAAIRIATFVCFCTHRLDGTVAVQVWRNDVLTSLVNVKHTNFSDRELAQRAVDDHCEKLLRNKTV